MSENSPMAYLIAYPEPPQPASAVEVLALSEPEPGEDNVTLGIRPPAEASPWTFIALDADECTELAHELMRVANVLDPSGS